jgi:hypothetical protein
VQHQTVSGIAGYGSSPGVATANDELPEPQIQFALRGFAAMAVKAIGFEDGTYLTFEGNRCGRVDVLGGTVSAANERAEDQNQQCGRTMQAREWRHWKVPLGGSGGVIWAGRELEGQGEGGAGRLQANTGKDTRSFLKEQLSANKEKLGRHQNCPGEIFYFFGSWLWAESFEHGSLFCG